MLGILSPVKAPAALQGLTFWRKKQTVNTINTYNLSYTMGDGEDVCGGRAGDGGRRTGSGECQCGTLQLYGSGQESPRWRGEG